MTLTMVSKASQLVRGQVRGFPNKRKHQNDLTSHPKTTQAINTEAQGREVEIEGRHPRLLNT